MITTPEQYEEAIQKKAALRNLLACSCVLRKRRLYSSRIRKLVDEIKVWKISQGIRE